MDYLIYILPALPGICFAILALFIPTKPPPLPDGMKSYGDTQVYEDIMGIREESL